MVTSLERTKGFSELPVLRAQRDELKLKLESLEKIKSTISGEDYLNLSSTYLKQLEELNSKIDDLQSGISELKNEIELDSKVLESENSIMEKELRELQFLSQQGALSKQDYDFKRNTCQQKINKNKSLIVKNQSGYMELDFYANYVGIDSYLMHSYNTQVSSLKTKLSDSGNSLKGLLLKSPSLLKSKVLISFTSILIILFILIKIFGSDRKKSQFTDPRDGKVYKTIHIGKQVWMSENLAYKVSSGCWAYDNNENNAKKFGYLYVWETAKTVCPGGWHLPSDGEWAKLTDFLGGGKIAGSKLKESSILNWHSSNNKATNVSGFKALPGGSRNENSTFENLGKYGNWWSSTENSTTDAWERGMMYDYSGVARNGYPKQFGFSVRCLRDH